MGVPVECCRDCMQQRPASGQASQTRGVVGKSSLAHKLHDVCNPTWLMWQEPKILAAMDAAAQDGGVVIIEHSGMLEASFTAKLAAIGKHSASADGHGWHLVLLTNKPQNLKKAALDFETICLEPAQVSGSSETGLGLELPHAGSQLSLQDVQTCTITTFQHGLPLSGHAAMCCNMSGGALLPAYTAQHFGHLTTPPGSLL